jgi:signal transduction histidine kinase
MNRKLAARLAWSLWGLYVTLAAAGVTFTLLRDTPGFNQRPADTVDVLFRGSVEAAIFLAMSTVGALIASRRGGNAVGWLFIAIALGGGLTAASYGYARWAILGRAHPLPGSDWAAWLADWAWITFFSLVLTFLPLLFPDGRLPSPRWRPFAWISGGFLILAATIFALDPDIDFDLPVRNPIGVPGFEQVAVFFDSVGFLVFMALGLTAVTSLVLRYRRVHDEQRHQIKWLLSAVGLIALINIVFPLIGALGVHYENSLAEDVAIFIGFSSVPVGAAIAIFKYRLYDIDVVINKTLVYGSLAAFITAVYVGVVVGIGSIFGRGDEPNLGLSILATAVVAVAFQPVRERVQRVANRLVYGARATPYEVLSEFSHRMAGTYAAEDVLPRMARILAEGTGAREARVWLRVGGELRPAASWPESSSNGAAPNPQEADLLVPVVHQGEDLGALSIAKAPGDRLTPAEDKLARDLASQAGLVLRNVKLIEDLKASRVRLVAAQDEERRRIERNIHDGAQQQLVALQVKLGLTRSIAPKDPARAERLLRELQTETEQALSDLRDLARGIYPPLLQDQGLRAALEAQARKSPIPVGVHADGIGRYAQEVEAAVYFCVLEALQNVAKYARATQATVRLAQSNGDLAFEVTDDGAGFDPDRTLRGSGLINMADRLAALGGEIGIRSAPGEGTTVVGRLWVRALEPVA